MIVLVFGVFVAPTTIWAGYVNPGKAFGLSAVLFVGHCICLAGHYEMFNPNTERSMVYFPVQERVSIMTVAIVALVYIVVASYS